MLAGVLAACGSERGGLTAVVASVTLTPVPTDSPLPTATVGTVGPLEATLDPEEIGQGESGILLVRQEAATGGSVRLLGQQYPLIRQGSALWTVIGIGLGVPLGEQVASITTRTSTGEEAGALDLPFRVVPVERPVDYLVASPEVTAVLTPEAAEIEAALREFEQYNVFEARPRWKGTLEMPAEGWITTEFGQGRSINGGPVGGFHGGVDIANDAGTPILAPAGARVAWVGAMPIRGNSVLLDHGAGVVTGYHHLQEATVDVGDLVVTGDEIALMGSTGFSTGPHLHWEMTIFGVNVDPMTWTRQVFLPRSA